MSVFSDAEITYLQSQRLARIATAGRDSQPHVVPVSFRYNRFDPPMFRIWPKRIISIGLEGEGQFGLNARTAGR